MADTDEMDRAAHVLVIDDDEATRSSLCEYLGHAGYQVRSARSGAEGLEAVQVANNLDIVLLDLVMPEVDGFELLKRYRERGGDLPVVVLSALSAAEDVVRTMKLGATDYLPRPFDPHELDLVLRRVLESRSVVPGAQVAIGEGEDGAQLSLSGAMEHVWTLVRRVADSDVPVLLVGESGVGKDVVARRIHSVSPRAQRAFVKINCAALPGELLESELFGHEKGAFTGAYAEKPGKFELAHQGTIFLDEIGEMDPRLQAKLLQVLQDEEFYRVGGRRPIKVDARVVVATNRDLESAIADASFREDLYYRLNVVTIRVPPLRDRKEDVEPLACHFVDKYCRRYRGGLERVPAEVMQRFLAYDWPGNVRELENMVRRLVVLRDPGMVLAELGRSRAGAAAVKAPPFSPGGLQQPIPSTLQAPLPDDAPLKEVSRRAARLAEREAILRALTRTGWNKRKAAKRLQISYKALLYKVKECEIVDPRDAARIE